MPLFISQLIQYISTGFDLAGVILVVWGGAVAIVELVRLEILNFGKERKKFVEKLRIDFGQKIVLGIEFFLAGDLLRLIEEPSTERIIRVGGIVLMRTILAYFLSKEIDKHK